MISPDDLLAQADLLSGASATETDLRRAVSAAYYAVFHTVLADSADLLLGAQAAERERLTWSLVYRAHNHGEIARRCASLFNPPAPLSAADFPAELTFFGSQLRTLQAQRQAADYDPLATFSEADVAASVELAHRSIAALRAAPIEARRLFAVYLLLGARAG